MTNKKFKKAAMALALTACVAATPLAANAETPENAADVQAPAAVDHTEADTQEAPEAELPAEEEPEAQPAAEAAAQPAAPEATPIAVELPTAEETPEDEEAPEEKEEAPEENAVVEKETPAKVTPTEDAVVEKETPAEVAPAPAKVAPAPAEVAPIEDAVVEKVTPAEADVDNLIEDPDAGIATMDGVEKEVSEDAATITGGKSYSTLDDALKDAKTGNEVVLQKNHTGNIKIAEWIKLNLNGKKIEGNVDVDLSKKQDDTAASQDGETAVEKKVEIVDGTITGGTDSGVKIIGADVKLENVNVTGNSSQGNGGGIYVEDGSVEIIGGSVSNNTAVGLPDQSGIQGGGGIYAVRSDVVLKDTTVSNNTVTGANSDGGGVLVKNGSLTVTDSTISDNTAPDQGGGIAAAWSDLEITDSTISGNKAAVGAGILTEDSKAAGEHTHTITNSKIQNNEASNIGGGMYIGTCSDMTITDSTLSGNTATNQGGAIVAYSARNVTLDHTTVKGNKAASGGGILSFGTALADTHITLKNGTEVTENMASSGAGLYAWSVGSNPIQIDIEKSSITNNTATNAGGGIFAYIGVKVRADGADISGNKAVNGGGLYLYGTAADPSRTTVDLINKTTITNNSATSYGGGIFAYDGVKVTADDIELSGNTAANAGGLFLWNNSSADLNNSEVSGNKATGNGGGVYVYDATCSLTASNGTVFRENSGHRGGGIFSSGGTVTVEDSTFEKNTATDDGGAIAATQNSSLTVRNSKVLENKAADTAGGILAEKSTLEVTDSIIDGNRASVGGGLYIADIDAPGETKEDKPEHTITRTEITNNTADGQGIGGGIYLGAQKLTITDSKLTGNNTISNNGQTQGGAIVAYSPGDFTLDNTLIQGNTADVGGGIHVLSTKLRDSHIILCNNTRITGNVANLFGGGIFLDNMNNPAVLELVNASVDNNTANVAGGIGNYGSIVVLKDGAVLKNNTAKQYGGGLYNRGKVTVESGATVMNNTASTYGGGLYNKGEAIVESGAKLYNNHAALAGDDIYLAGKNSTLTLTKVGDDWMLDDCGHKINGWFADLLDARWDADGKQEHVINLKDYAADGLTIVENEDGSYTITILDENATLALKAAHNVTPKPTPDPDPEPTPDPDTPDTPVSPEDPTTPPVQDATPDDAETPVNSENPANPPVQDATPDTVAALPKTGVNWFTALAMALSGMALMAAGAFTSLFAKSKH